MAVGEWGRSRVERKTHAASPYTKQRVARPTLCGAYGIGTDDPPTCGNCRKMLARISREKEAAR